MTEAVAGIDVPANIRAVADRIADAERAAGRPAGSVTLVAISKAHPQSRARAALETGHRVFGENRIQEAADKWPALRESFPDAKLHLVGHLQTNKARQAIGLFDVIETVDRPRLARILASEMERLGRRPSCFVQVNTGEEPQKGGIAPAEADRFIESCIEDMALPIEGLMCIPPIGEEPALHFGLLGEIARDPVRVSHHAQRDRTRCNIRQNTRIDHVHPIKAARAPAEAPCRRTSSPRSTGSWRGSPPSIRSSSTPT